MSRSGCADCAHGLDHCHGALAWHLDGSVECLGELDCTVLASTRHLLVMRCREIEPRCGCSEGAR